MRGIRFLPVVTVLLLTGCEACQTSDVEEDGGTGGSSGMARGDAGNSSSGGPDAGGSSGAPDAGQPKNTLTFNGTTPVDVAHGAGQDLQFTVRDPQNQPIGTRVVQFMLTGTGGTLSTSATSTNSQGVATVRFTAGNSNGDLVLTATTENANPATVAIRVRAPATGTVNISVLSSTRIPVTRASLYVYAGASGAVPTCAALTSAATPPSGGQTGMLNAVPGQQAFTGLASNASITAFATGTNATGDIVASGCTEGGVVLGGQTTTVTVTLLQKASILAGDYDVRMQMDLGAGLPQPYDDYVNTTTLVLANPAAVIAYYVCREVDRVSGITDFVQREPPLTGEATLEEVLEDPSTYNGVNNVVAPQLETLITSNQTVAPIYNRIVTVGQDLRQATTSFEIGSHFKLTEQTGTAGMYQVDETWQDIVLSWRTGCVPETDLGCARRLIELRNTNHSPVMKTYNALTGHEPTTGTGAQSERYKVLPDAHPFAFSYGAAILAIMEQAVFPSLCTGCTSVEDVLASVVDCAAIGTWAEAELGFVSAMQGADACTAGLGLVSGLVETRALDLTVGGQNPELGTKDQPGLRGGGVFYLVDADKDLRTELVTELSMSVQWRDPMDSTFTQDVTAPITGAGRMSATDCVADASCTASYACLPVAHYMQVKQLEYTCKRAVGMTAGGAACQNNNECRTGVCVGINGSTPGTCYRACATSAQCGGGTCEEDRTTVDLDPIMSGLGDADARGCNP